MTIVSWLDHFCLVTSDQVTHRMGETFEFISSVVLIDLFGEDYASEITSLTDSYNSMCKNGNVVKAIGHTIAKWIASPTEEHFSKLVGLYKLCKENA